MDPTKIKVGMSTLLEMNAETEELKRKFDVLYNDVHKKQTAAKKKEKKDA